MADQWLCWLDKTITKLMLFHEYHHLDFGWRVVYGVEGSHLNYHFHCYPLPTLPHITCTPAGPLHSSIIFDLTFCSVAWHSLLLIWQNVLNIILRLSISTLFINIKITKISTAQHKFKGWFLSKINFWLSTKFTLQPYTNLSSLDFCSLTALSRASSDSLSDGNM